VGADASSAAPAGPLSRLIRAVHERRTSRKQAYAFYGVRPRMTSVADQKLMAQYNSHADVLGGSAALQVRCCCARVLRAACSLLLLPLCSTHGVRGEAPPPPAVRQLHWHAHPAQHPRAPMLPTHTHQMQALRFDDVGKRQVAVEERFLLQRGIIHPYNKM
jgi:hypothetical protein